MDFIYKHKEIPFLIKGIIGHYYFENEHPFYEANGRVGRYILAKHLSRRLDKFSGLILSQKINKKKSKYYKTFAILGHYLNRVAATNFVVDILDMIYHG